MANSSGRYAASRSGTAKRGRVPASARPAFADRQLFAAMVERIGRLRLVWASGGGPPRVIKRSKRRRASKVRRAGRLRGRVQEKRLVRWVQTTTGWVAAARRKIIAPIPPRE
jgi:hypothetical protein